MSKLLRMKYCLFFFLLLAQISNAFSRDLAVLEDSIAFFHTQLAKSKVDSVSDRLSGEMRRLFIECFEQENVFEHAFQQLKFSNLTSSDGKVRIFNWNQPLQDGTYKYYCFILRKKNDKKEIDWFELIDYSKEPDKVENKYLNADKWIGALYYSIIPLNDKKDNDVYILLGWDGKDDLTTRKMIDAIEFTGNKVRLGAPIFPGAMGNQKRILFEYSNDVSMSVKYYDKKKCIVVDHLAPKNAMMQGIFADYGPDGSYDLYQLEKGKFVLYENIDISEFSSSDDKPYFDPRPQNNRRRR